MKFSGWSTILLGALLSTTAIGAVRAEGVGRPMIAAVADRTTGAVADDVTDTGSIAPVAAPNRSVLQPLVPRAERAPTPPAGTATATAPSPEAMSRADLAASPRSTPVETATPAPATTPDHPRVDPIAAIDAAATGVPVPPPIEASTPAAPSATDRPTATGSTADATAASTATPPPAAAPAVSATPSPEAVAASLAEQQAAEAMEKAAPTVVGRGGSTVERAERAALADFYRARGWKPLFVGAADLTAEGRALAGVLAASDRDGLDPTDYALPQRRDASPEARAAAEWTLAETALRFVRHLASGRFDPARLSDLVTPHPPRPDPAEVLRGIAASRDLAATLAAWAPPHEGYRRLKKQLAELRAETEVPVVRLPDGPLLAPGQKDERVALLRERMGLAAVTSDADPATYDPALAEAVKAFQRERGIAANGKVGRTTLAALNEESRGTADRIADVVVNMERWRWLPRDLGELHVFVNIPDFHLDVVRDGKSIHHARVITGRPENQTPIFSETMEYVVVNPYWNVPYSIVKKEMMGRLQSGRLGGSYEVEVGNRTVDPSSIDWSSVSPAQVSIRQRPGDGNALGNIKFMFPNQHSVYIHDTSSRGLFSRDYRALSHGCVRVAEPFSFADAVLSEEPSKLDGARLKKLLGRSEQQINLQRRVPVHITYFTEFVDDAGQLQTRRDIYGHDAKMRRILGL